MKREGLLSKYNSILAQLQKCYLSGTNMQNKEYMKSLQMQFAEVYHEIQEKINATDDKKDTTTTVTIDIFRYEELLDLESRVDTLAAYVRHHETVSAEDMFLILGYTDDAKSAKEREKDAKVVITK